MKNLIFIIFIFIFSFYSYAKEDINWQKMPTAGGVELYLASDFIRWSGRNLEFPLLISSDEYLPNYQGRQVKSAIIVIELNCDKYVYANQLIITKSEPMGKGNTIFKEEHPDIWIDLKVANSDWFKEFLFYTCEEDKVKEQLKKIK